MSHVEKLKQKLEETLPEMIARKAIDKYTGGLYVAKTLQCYDSLGTGPKDPIKTTGGEVFYTKQNLIDWIIERIQTGESK